METLTESLLLMSDNNSSPLTQLHSKSNDDNYKLSTLSASCFSFGNNYRKFSVTFFSLQLRQLNIYNQVKFKLSLNFPPLCYFLVLPQFLSLVTFWF